MAYAEAVPASKRAGRHVQVRTPAARVSATGLGLLVAVLGAGAVALIVAADLAVGGAGYHTWGVVAFASTFPVLPLMGWVLAVKRPGNPLGWLFLGSALAMAAAGFAHGYGEYGVEARPGSLPAPEVVLALGGLGWLGFAVPAVFVPLLYPDGRPLSARWLATAWADVALLGLLVVAALLRPGPYEHFSLVDNPFGVEALAEPIDLLYVVDAPLLFAAVGVSAASLVLRMRASAAQVRRQLAMLTAVAVMLVAVEFVGSAVLPGDLHGAAVVCSWADGPTSSVFGAALPMIVYVGLPVAVAVAVLRHNLYGIDRLVRHSAVYVTLWLAIAAGYVALAWLLGVAVTGQLPVGAAIAVTIGATLVFAPARRSLEGLADRWVFGERPSGYELASDFGAHLGDTDDLTRVAAQLAEITRRGLGLRWVAVTLSLGADRAHAGAGEPAEAESAVLTMPVGGDSAISGEIRCGPPPEPGRISADGRRLVELLARQAAAALRTAALARDLAASRVRIIAAAEEERRRIERDIHDGAQQEIVAMMAKMRLAMDRAGPESDVAVALRELQTDAKAALVGIRDLAQGIHPSVLSDAGLVAAVEARAVRLPLAVQVRSDPATRGWRGTDAVEGAAYLVVSEAIANVLKHAEATAAVVELHLADCALLVQIADDGRGFEPDTARGDGLVQLADRVAGLGGTLRVRSSPGGGTRIAAEFPVREAAG